MVLNTKTQSRTRRHLKRNTVLAGLMSDRARKKIRTYPDPEANSGAYKGPRGQLLGQQDSQRVRISLVCSGGLKELSSLPPFDSCLFSKLEELAICATRLVSVFDAVKSPFRPRKARPFAFFFCSCLFFPYKTLFE